MTINSSFDPACRLCPRLAEFLDAVRAEEPSYHCRPVPPFGDSRAGLLIVGLAPGKHGANRSGRPFTGDYAGILLYETLFKHGLSSAPQSVSVHDGLELRRTRITNAVKCLPPENKPLPEEISRCNDYLKIELAGSPEVKTILALGRIAHEAALRALGLKPSRFKFAHGAEHDLGSGRTLLDSYHCSRYNTQTKRLTEKMFDAVVARGVQLAF